MNEDISTATTLKLILEPKIGDFKEITVGLTVGTVNINVGNQTYIANQYMEYTTKAKDLDKSGQWRKKGSAVQSPQQTLISDYERFTVRE